MKPFVRALSLVAAVWAMSSQASASTVVVDISTSFGSGSIELLGSSGGLSEVGSFTFQTATEQGSEIFTRDHLADLSFEISGGAVTKFDLSAMQCWTVSGTGTDSCLPQDHGLSDLWNSAQLNFLFPYGGNVMYGAISCFLPSASDPSVCGPYEARPAGRFGDGAPVYTVSAVPVPLPAGLLLLAMAGLAGLGALGRRSAPRAAHLQPA